MAENPWIWDPIQTSVPSEAEALADSTGGSPDAGAQEAQDQLMEAAEGEANAMAMLEQESGEAVEAAAPMENAMAMPGQESSEAAEAAASMENAIVTPEHAAEAAAPMENSMATPGDALEAPSMAAPELREPLCEEASGVLAPTQPKLPAAAAISTLRTSTPISSQAEGEPAVPKKAMAKVSLQLRPSIFGKNVLSKVSLSPSESNASDEEGYLSPGPSPSAEPSQPSKLGSESASAPVVEPKARPRAASVARPRAASVARQLYSQVVAGGGFGGAFFSFGNLDIR